MVLGVSLSTRMPRHSRNACPPLPLRASRAASDRITRVNAVLQIAAHGVRTGESRDDARSQPDMRRPGAYERHAEPLPAGSIRSTLCAVAYNDELVERVRDRLVATEGAMELKMFGGWGVTVHGNMAVGVMDSDLIVRVGPDAFDAALRRPGARPFDFTGRPMTGWVFVDGAAITNTRSLNRWIDQGVTFAESLPRKSSTRGSRRSRDRTR